MIKRTLFQFTLLFALALLTFSCESKRDVDAFKEAKYSLEGVEEIRLNGIDLLEKKRPEDFSFSDAAVLYSAVADNKLSAFSKLGLRVDLGEGSKDRSMTVTQMKWQLLVDGKHTLSGLVNEPVELHDGINTIAVQTPVTLMQENGRTDFNGLIRLATTLSQADKSKRPNLTLQIKPTIQTSVGPFEVPSFINIKQ